LFTIFFDPESEVITVKAFFDIFLGCGFFVKSIVDPMDVLKIFVRKRDPDMAIR
jgi:hypothetical protein